MPQKPFTSDTVYDGLASFEAGMNSGNAPMLLPANQLSFATNITVRGAYATHRPPFSIQTLDFGGDSALESAFKFGLWQGGCYAKPDTGSERLVCMISGHVYQLTPSLTGWVVQDVSVPGDYDDPTVTQAWLWQAEFYVIITNGTPALPIFLDLNTSTSRRSIGNTAAYLTITTALWTQPANGLDTVPLTLAAAPSPQWPAGTPIIGLFGEYVVKSLVGTALVLTRTSDVNPATGKIAANALIYAELPAGRMGCYGMNRQWMSLIDGKQFIAGDILGGPSGTVALNGRDAVLRVTENSYIAGGGYFAVPGSYGDIRAMLFTTTLDASMGQGPLQVVTPTAVFSCMAPTDRSTWASVTNPILTMSLISNGGEAQNSTLNVNGDVMMRSVDGIRSLILGRREFNTWGNVPMSSEMDRVLSLDQQDLLIYSSSIVFDNRLLMTAGPSAVPSHGVFHPGLIALNFDPLSNLRGKQPSVYDGLWTGINTLQLVVGRFAAQERAFSFSYNASTGAIELYEILRTPQDVFATTTWPAKEEIMDNGFIPITWSLESPVLFKDQNPILQTFHRWLDGEVVIDNLVGTVDFAAYYKPDQYPCWVPWFSWKECAGRDSTSSKPQFRPRMGLGEPDSRPCDPSTNRPMREGYTFQFKLIIQGHCRILGMRFKAITLPIPVFAVRCNPSCLEAVVA